MRRRTAALALCLPVAWVVGTAAGADADEGHAPAPAPVVVEDHSEHGGVRVPASPDAPSDDRPLPLVLGVFGGVNGAVVLGAAVVRRRERRVRQARKAARSERRAVPALAPEDPR